MILKRELLGVIVKRRRRRNIDLVLEAGVAAAVEAVSANPGKPEVKKEEKRKLVVLI